MPTEPLMAPLGPQTSRKRPGAPSVPPSWIPMWALDGSESKPWMDLNLDPGWISTLFSVSASAKLNSSQLDQPGSGLSVDDVPSKCWLSLRNQLLWAGDNAKSAACA